MSARSHTEGAPPTTATLETLMAAYAGGDSRAASGLYRGLAPRLRGYLSRYTHDRALVEDVIQTTFAKLHRVRDTYDRVSAVAPWVSVIARRVLVDELRAARTRGEILTDDGILPDAPGTPVPTRDTALALERALADLPAAYRTAIELTTVQGYTGGEAAVLLRTTRSAVKLRVHRGYRLLRQRLDAAA